MTSDHEAREAARMALEGFELHLQAGVPSRITFGRYESEQVVRAAIDAYNAKLREGMGDERDRLRAALFAWWDSLGPDDEVVADPLIDAILAALSAKRQDHTDLIAQIRSEANIADRPGQFDRLNAIADALEGKSNE